MADVKFVTSSVGVKLYTGAGRHPFVAGDGVAVPAAHADDLATQDAVEHIVPPEPAPLG